jgi:hypothetical protein
MKYKRRPPHPLYRRWNWICQVTTNTNDPNWPAYGGAGIKNQFNSWHEFRDYVEATLGLPTDKLNKLNRIDQQGDYAPGNLRWATPTLVGRNYPYNHYMTYKGHSRTLAEWAELFGINYQTLFGRYKKGWTPEQCLGLHPSPKFAHLRKRPWR